MDGEEKEVNVEEEDSYVGGGVGRSCRKQMMAIINDDHDVVNDDTVHKDDCIHAGVEHNDGNLYFEAITTTIVLNVKLNLKYVLLFT